MGRVKVHKKFAEIPQGRLKIRLKYVEILGEGGTKKWMSSIGGGGAD